MSEIHGLSYVPDLGEQNSLQYYDELWINIAQQTRPEDYFSFKNRTVLLKCMQALNLHIPTDTYKFILEIGIGRKERLVNTSTFTFLGYKALTTRYFGIDAKPRDYIRDITTNVEVELALSKDVFKKWAWDIDLLHIDGGHSLKDTLADWQFSKFVKPYGIIVIHDIKAHPGPIELVKAIDRDIYTVHDLFKDDPKDFGMAVVYKKENDYDSVCS
ncbi:MAG: class I SAM-dependent methyltransferase [Candidatus Thorarchaeota archaeon]|jgi:hypothetical protein